MHASLHYFQLITNFIQTCLHFYLFPSILMALHFISFLFLLFVAIASNHAALSGNDGTTGGDGEMDIHVTAHRKLVGQATRLRRGRGQGRGRLGGKIGFANVTVGIGGVDIKAGKKGQKPIYVGVKPGKNPFLYDYKPGNQTSPAGRSLFFLQKDMKHGHQVTLNLTQNTNKATFLPKETARSLPFSTDKLQEILQEFSMQPGSEEAQIIAETIRGCESMGIPGEDKYCATCLEDMVDYAKSSLGDKVKAISTKGSEEYNKGGRYTIEEVVRVGGEDGVMVCHKQNYAYAVYYCHKNKGTTSHIVSLTSQESKKGNVVVVCHKDTSGWNPAHLAFQVLNVKPGTLPICHFLPQDHLAWVRA